MRKVFPIVSNVNIGLNTTIDGIEYVNFGTKDASKYQLPKDSFVVNSGVIATNAGTASKSVIVFSGSFAAGDQVRITLSIKNSTQTIIKNFVHTVVDTTASVIVTAIENLITAAISQGLPGIASAAQGPAGTLTITSSSLVSNNFSATTYTSGSGSVAATFTGVTQAEGVAAVLQAAGVPAADITLATYDTVLLTYKADAAIPFIDSEGKIVKEVKAFVPTGQGATLISRF